MLKKAANLMDKRLSPLTAIAGNIGAGVIAVMMLLTVSDVVGRRVFNQPVYGAYELSEYMLVIVAFFTVAHCQFLRGHIRIDLVVSRIRQRSQDVVNSIMYVFFLLTFCVLAWRLCLYAIEEWQSGLTSALLGIPAFPFIFVSAVGCTLLSLVVLMHLLLFLAGALKK